MFEPPQPNTGLPAGRFLERAKVYKPGSKLVRGEGEAGAPEATASRQGAYHPVLPRLLLAGLVHRGRDGGWAGAGPARPPLPPDGGGCLHNAVDGADPDAEGRLLHAQGMILRFVKQEEMQQGISRLKCDVF